MGLIPGLGRSPREGNGNLLQYSCLENPMDREEPGGLQSMGLERVGYDWAITHWSARTLDPTCRGLNPSSVTFHLFFLCSSQLFSLSNGNNNVFIQQFIIDCILCVRRRQWQPTPVLLPEKSHGWRSLVGYSPWGRKESDMTERLHFHFSLSFTGEGNGNPLQYCCLENPKDRSLVGCHLWGCTELDTTDVT